MSRIIFNELHDGAADDYGVGKLANLLKLLGIGDSEADRDGQFGQRPQALDQRLRVACDFLAGAGDAGAGNGVNEAF